jgi:AcrR family transcriptional regulator
MKAAERVDEEQASSELFRRRLIEGMAEAVRVKGLSQTTVADVVRLAKTSRRTFYEHFATRDDCYIALIQERNTELVRSIVGAVDPEADWERQIETAIRAWMRTAAAEPELMRSWIREIPLLGSRGRAVQRESIAELVTMVQALASNAGMVRAGVAVPDRDVAIVLVGGLRELVATTVETGRDVAGIVDVAIAVTKSLAFATPAA